MKHVNGLKKIIFYQENKYFYIQYEYKNKSKQGLEP